MYRPNKPLDLTFAEMARTRSAERIAGAAPDLTIASEVDSGPDNGKKITATADESKTTESVDALHEPFSAELHKSRLDEGYFELAGAVRDAGNEPNDLQSWQDAVALRREMAATVAQFNRTRVVAGDARTRGEQTKNDLAEKIKQLSARFMDEVLPRVAAESHERVLEKEKNTPIAANDTPVRPKPAAVSDSSEDHTPAETRDLLRSHVEELRKQMADAGVHDMEGASVETGELPEGEPNDPHDSWERPPTAKVATDDPHDSWERPSVEKEPTDDPHDSWERPSTAKVAVDDSPNSWSQATGPESLVNDLPTDQGGAVTVKNTTDGEAVARGIRAEKLHRADGKAELAGVQNERDELLAAESALQSQERQFIGEHSALGRTVQNIFFRKGARELRGAEAAVDEKAANYHRALEESLKGRLIAKGYTPGTSEYEKVATRYRERVASKDVIDRAEEARVKSRTAAFEQKGNAVFIKAMQTLASMNATLEKSFLGKYGARGVRIVASATLASLVASLLTPLSAAAVASYAGSRVARSVVGAGVGGVAGVGAGELYQKLGGARAEKKLADSRKTTVATHVSIRDTRAAYRSGNKEAVARKRRVVEMLTAALVGGATSLSTAYVEALTKAPEAVTGLVDHPLTPTQALPEVRVPPVADHIPEGVAPYEFHLEPGDTPNHPHLVEGPPPTDVAPERLAPVDPVVPSPRDISPPHIEAAPPAGPPAAVEPSVVHPTEEVPIPGRVEALSTVHATKGHGYEYMAKRLSEQLRSQHIDVSHLDPTSDAYKLATATPRDIDSLVHKMATQNNFYRGPDGSVRVGLNAELSVNSDGSLAFNDGMGHTYTHAPATVPTTPNVAHTPAALHTDGTPSQAQVLQTAERLRAWHAANPDVPNMAPSVDAAGDVYGPPGAHTVDPPWMLEHPSASGSHALESFTNPHGVEVNLSQPHVYAIEGGKTVVDGGSYEDRLQVAIGYVQQHGGSVQVEAKAPVRVNGVLTRYLETVKKSGPFGLGGHIETSPLSGSPRAADLITGSRERFATRFIKKLQ